MHLGAIGRAVLLAASPLLAHGMFVEPLHAFPRVPSVPRPKQALRRRSRIPDVRFAPMSRRQPEDMVHDKALLPFGNFWKCRRRLSFFPGLAEVGRSKDGRSQVARARGREQRASVAWVQHEMMDDVPEEHWL